MSYPLCQVDFEVVVPSYCGSIVMVLSGQGFEFLDSVVMNEYEDEAQNSNGFYYSPQVGICKVPSNVDYLPCSNFEGCQSRLSFLVDSLKNYLFYHPFIGSRIISSRDIGFDFDIYEYAFEGEGVFNHLIPSFSISGFNRDCVADFSKIVEVLGGS